MGIAVGTFAITGLAVVLRVAARVPMTPDLLFFVVDATVGLVYGTVGAVILSRRSHPVGWLVALTGVGGAVAALGGAWGVYQAEHPNLPPLPGLATTVSWAWVPGTLALFLVVPWLVRDTPLTAGAWTGLVAGAALTVALTVQRLSFPMSDPTASAVVVVLGLVTAAATWWRHRHGPRERPGLGLLTLGTALMALSFVPCCWSIHRRPCSAVPLPTWRARRCSRGAAGDGPAEPALGDRPRGQPRGAGGAADAGLVVVYALWSGPRRPSWAAPRSPRWSPPSAWCWRSSPRTPARAARPRWSRGRSPGRAALRMGRAVGARAAELLDRLAEAVGEALGSSR